MKALRPKLYRSAAYCSVLAGILLLFFLSSSISKAAAQNDAAAKTSLSIQWTPNTTQPTNSYVKVTLTAFGGNGVYMKAAWAVGSKDTSYFANKGKEIRLTGNTGEITIKKNGSYTVYIEDSRGNAAISKIRINNIDTTGPAVAIKKSTSEYTKNNLTVRITAADKDTGIGEVRYLRGRKKVNDFQKAGKKISLKKGTGSLRISQNGAYTFYISDRAGNALTQTINVSNIDTEAPSLSADYSVMNQEATINVTAKDEDSGIETIKYLKGSYSKSSSKWKSDGKVVSNKKDFTVSSSGTYSILATDAAGNSTLKKISIQMEMKAVWISYLEFMHSKGSSEQKFQSFVDSMFQRCVDMDMNTVIVQVRPYGDAMYESEYFPWSVYASGKQGKDPGYDPFEYMVNAAHKRGLQIHAWINPYRVSSQSSLSSLSSDNPAKLWRSNSSTKRYVLTYGGKLYYNPAIFDVQKLIVNGVKEIVENYDVDGIHFDDYFYPSLGSNYKNNFDAAEYKAYLKNCAKKDSHPKDIVTWRRDNVNTLVKSVYQAIKKEDPSCVFGISPAGNIDNLLSKSSYYVDIKKWLSSLSYIDYICPQIYWGMNHQTAPFKKVTDRWLSLRTSDTVNIYLGLAAYKCGVKSSTDMDWSTSKSNLKDQVIYGRKSGEVDGYVFFRYDSMLASNNKKEVSNVVSELKKK